MKKKIVKIVCIVVVSVIVLFWALNEIEKRFFPGPEVFSENLEYAYQKYWYEVHYYDMFAEDWREMAGNLSDTAEPVEENQFEARGCCVITDFNQLNQLRNTMETKLETARSKSDPELYYEPIQYVNTLQSTIDEAYFATHNILVVDICIYGEPYFQTRLKQIEMNGSECVVSMQIERRYGYTADWPGNIYFIEIPKECINATVNYESAEWAPTP